MAKRQRDISITDIQHISPHTLSIWRDPVYSLIEQIEGIEGVGGAGMSPQTETFDNIWVSVNGCYDINKVAEEIRELANNRAVLSAGNE